MSGIRPGVPEPLATPDGRYIVVRGRLWRSANPRLAEDERQQLVDALMTARRTIRTARDDAAALRGARAAVQLAKVRLGERGPVWWDDGAPDYNRRLARNTPYAAWFALASEGDHVDLDAKARESPVAPSDRFAVASTPSSNARKEGSMATAKKAVSKKVAAKKVAAKKSVAKKAPAKKSIARKAAIKRTLVEPHPGDKRYVRRDPKGQFKDVVDAGKSISANMRSTTTTKAKPGQGDKGDTNL